MENSKKNSRSLIYRDKKDVKTSCRVLNKRNGVLELIFSSNCGIFGTQEILDTYNLTPTRLLQILQERDDYSEDEI